jgi:urease accessory protein
MRPVQLSRVAAVFIATLTSIPALAHPEGHATMGSFGAGLAHPFSGLDHLLSMLAVGIWSTQQRGRATWLLPLAFPLVMLMGAALALGGVTLPFIESGILAALVVLGMAITFALRLPAVAGTVMVGLFALLHGQAHALELPAGTSPMLYGAGFVMATAILHLLGIGLARHSGQLAGRAAGIFITLCGIYMIAA